MFSLPCFFSDGFLFFSIGKQIPQNDYTPMLGGYISSDGKQKLSMVLVINFKSRFNLIQHTWRASTVSSKEGEMKAEKNVNALPNVIHRIVK